MVKLGMSIFTIFFSVAVVFSCRTSRQAVAQSCDNLPCASNQECRYWKQCNGGSCSVQPICLNSTVHTGHRYTCEGSPGPLLEVENGNWMDVTCYNGRPCPNGFFCNTAVMDTYSHCCQSNKSGRPAVKSGDCPAPNPPASDYNFCVDTCGVDGDCPWSDKCCPGYCAKECRRALDPCRNKTCPSGSFCRALGSPCADPNNCPAEGECSQPQ